jgi:hypothetical protein
MRRVLIVSPSFPPTSAPELHRVRASLPYYSSCGWKPTVLCVSPQTHGGLHDAALGKSLPADIDVKPAKAWDERTCRRLGFGHLAWRSLIPLYRKGRRLLKGTATTWSSFPLLFFFAS